MPVKVTKTIEIANKFLEQIRLPNAEIVSSDTEYADSYAIVAQFISNLIKNKEKNDYIAGRIAGALSKIGHGTTPPSAEKETATEWIAWLKSLPEIAVILAEREKIAATANPLLKFLLRIAELQDMEGLSKSEGKRIYSLERLRSGPPNPILGCTDATLAFALPGKKHDTYDVLLTITLSQKENGPFSGRPGPTDHSIMAINDQRFFNDDGEPLGEYEAEQLTTSSGRAWPAAALADWDGFMAEIDRRCQEMFGGVLHEFPQIVFGNSTKNLTAFIVDQKNIRPGLWVNAYKNVIEGIISAPAIDAVINGHPQNKERSRVRMSNAQHNHFMGHMDTRDSTDGQKREAYPLDRSQRLAAVTALTLGIGNKERILPVNGPPGTGKTSFLRAVLASLWVKSALNQDPHPPVVYGTGFTNKSVSNMIEAFSTVQNMDGSQINGRWLKGLPSYGWFHPSNQASQEHPDYMQLRYSSQNHDQLHPQGAARDFADTPLAEQTAIYQERGHRALNLPILSPVTQIVETLHTRIQEHSDSLLNTQKHAEEWINREIPLVWSDAHHKAGIPAALDKGSRSTAKEIAKIDQSIKNTERALELGDLYERTSRTLHTPWRSKIPEKIRRWWWKSGIEDLSSVEDAARKAFAAVSVEWAAEPSLLQYNLQNLNASLKNLEAQRSRLIALNTKAIEQIKTIQNRRTLRRHLWMRLRQVLYPQRNPGELASIRYVVMLSDKDPEKRKQATDMLIARMEAYCDLKYRIPLFHLAARYWEGRWLLSQKDTESKTNADYVHERMMLGVIIVATTHKLQSLGRLSTADYLVMDEAGQCAPEIAVGTLSLTNRAIMVGDTRQLQPIDTLTGADTVRQTARLVGIMPDDLPDALNPHGGSGMTVAQRACGLEDGTGEAGITLLFHYRCHPQIIEYCNQLLYAGMIIPVRKNIPNRSGIPPMSWVDVDDEKVLTSDDELSSWGSSKNKGPMKVGSSWKNPSEIDAIIHWVKDSHKELTEVYGKPLDEVLAIITPLAGQAESIEKAVKTQLSGVIDEPTLKKMIVGTVHRLQGAERPVVVFSLVQHNSLSPNLFADRDGGFLMNVAVSRAKDSFIIFAQRSTLAPTIADQSHKRQEQVDTPIGKLGRYLSEEGTRLYPRSLVVIEAPGKTRAIQRALGVKAAVIATKGNIKESRPAPFGGLFWAEMEATYIPFAEAMRLHQGLLDDLVIATDDDIAGELIGLHVAEAAAEILGSTVPVRRMRFHDLTPRHLQAAYQTAGRNFDVNMLAAALLRELARHQDEEKFKKHYPHKPYISAQQRDALLTLAEMNERIEKGQQIVLRLEHEDGSVSQGFVVSDTSTMAAPATFTETDAKKIAVALAPAFAQNTPLRPSAFRQVEQTPKLYPPSTTARILALAADELHITPWETQEHLNALYQEGANHE